MKGSIKRYIIKNHLAVIALLISSFAIIPQIKDFVNVIFPTDIVFNENSLTKIVCRINHKENKKNNKLAILLYGLRVVGKNERPKAIEDYNIFVKYKGKWVKGINFYPKQYFDCTTACVVLVPQNRYLHTNSNGFDTTFIANGDTIFLMNWNKFISGKSEIEYAKSIGLCLAAFFPIDFNKYKETLPIKVVITDIFGHKYKFDIKEIGNSTSSLIQDYDKDTIINCK